ncbi:hypothetical protein ACX80O_15320 [Arthrobacter sp. Hz1]
MSGRQVVGAVVLNAGLVLLTREIGPEGNTARRVLHWPIDVEVGKSGILGHQPHQGLRRRIDADPQPGECRPRGPYSARAAAVLEVRLQVCQQDDGALCLTE